ncbi:MAG: hypothetical protein LQ350_005677 [Teloschistes chrysophthalmus]|nr:MAG: hypothetical protein LQ350_005677 [Niorma chrysophthalma]
MGSNQYSSQHSSSECSQAPFTPSETFFTPSISLLDPSQPSLHGEHEVNNSSQSDGVAQGQDQAITRFFPASGNEPIEAPIFPPEQGQYQDMSGAPNDDHFGQYIQPYDRPSLHQDTGAQFNVESVAANLHNAYGKDQLRTPQALRAAFSQSIDHVAQQPGPLSSTTTQRIPDATDEASHQWSTAFMAGGQFDQVPQAGSHGYEPSIDLPTIMQYDLDAATVARHNEWLYQYGTANQGTYHGMPLSQQTIDPPPDPDPVGPPCQASNGRRKRAPNRVERVRNRGRRTGPLGPQSRKNARSTRETGGSCWNCTLKRDQCLFENIDDVVCGDCKKMIGHSLLPECIRVRLPELITLFIPGEHAYGQILV